MEFPIFRNFKLIISSRRIFYREVWASSHTRACPDIFFFLSYRRRSAVSRLRILSILLSASGFGVSIPLGALERALVLSPSERSDIGCRCPDPSESIEIPGNSPGKSHELGYMSTSVASVVWLYCDITDRVKAFNKAYSR